MTLKEPPSDTQALARLMTWLSPAFPVGAFAYSQGLETVIAAGRISNAESLGAWIASGLDHGGARTDAIIAACAHRAAKDTGTLAQITALSLALVSAKERYDELVDTGQAFIEAAKAWENVSLETLPATCPYPVAVGGVVAAHGIARIDMLTAFLTAQVQSQISVGLRLIPIGQSKGLRLQAELEPKVVSLAQWAQSATLADIGVMSHGADIAMMAHQNLHSRIFKS